MKKSIFLLILLAGLFAWSCQKEQSLKTSFEKIESLESDVLGSIAAIEKYRNGLEQILLEAPDSKYAPQVWFKLAKLNEVFGHYDKAVDYYKNLVILFPGEPISSDGLFNLAQIYELHFANDKKAIEAFCQFITLYPNNKSTVTAYLKLGQLYCKQNDWARGIGMFELIIQKFPTNGITDDVQFRVADILDNKMNDKLKALAAYQLVAANYPGSPWANPAKKRIEKLTLGGENNEN